MKNKICFITGANSGIGKATALSLAKQGASVVMVCRNISKGQSAQTEIIEKSNNPNIDLIIADFSSQKDIRRASAEIISKYPVIDLLLNNAGAIINSRTETIDGIETTFATNHLGYFLFTDLLLDCIKASPKARIVNVASQVQQMARINFNNLQFQINYSPMRAYALSKLSNIMFTYELANRLKDTNVTVNCVHPGVVRTNFGNDLSGFTHFIFKFFSPFYRNESKGAETLIWLLTSPEVEGITGKYFTDKKQIKSQPDSYKAELQKKLWSISEELIRIK